MRFPPGRERGRGQQGEGLGGADQAAGSEMRAGAGTLKFLEDGSRVVTEMPSPLCILPQAIEDTMRYPERCRYVWEATRLTIDQPGRHGHRTVGDTGCPNPSEGHTALQLIGGSEEAFGEELIRSPPTRCLPTPPDNGNLSSFSRVPN